MLTSPGDRFLLITLTGSIMMVAALATDADDVMDRRPLHGSDAGSSTFHSGWTLHSAPPNSSDQMRPAMTVIYYADGARVSALDNTNRVADRDHWLPGTEPGDLAATHLNPVLG